MSYPKRVSIPVYGTKYHIEVDVSKQDCQEPVHCHVCSGRTRVAQIWLSSCSFQRTPSEISHNDRSRILDTVSSNRYELEEAYSHNRFNGAD